MKVLFVFAVGVVFLSFLCLPSPVQASNAMPSNLVTAIGTYESGWQQGARGRDGEIGIMQILPGTARMINAQFRTNYNLYTASGNVALGTLYLRFLWHIFAGNVDDVISAYNAGPWNVARHGIHNWRYVNDVLALMRRL